MPSKIRKFAANMLLGDEVRKINEAAGLWLNAYLRGPFEMPPEMLVSQLKEYDSTLLYDMVMQMGYDQIGGAYTSYLSDESRRIRAVNESRRLWNCDVTAQWIIWTWTNFGFGENIDIIPNDPDAEAPWHEFWEREENQVLLADDEIQALSEDLGVDGEVFFVYYISTLNGAVEVSIIEPLEIAEIIPSKTKAYKKLFYKRQYTGARNNAVTLYYPDLSIMNDPNNLDTMLESANFTGGVQYSQIPLATNVNPNTFVCVQHVPFNRKSRKMLRGWPLLTAGSTWIRSANQFEEHRATIAATVAMIVNKYKVEGGSRAIKDMQSAIASTLSAYNAIEGNPPPVGGSLVTNKAIDVDRMPLNTGGSDSKYDRDGLSRMAGLGGGLLAPWLGVGDFSRLATTTQMETPMLREFTRYQNFWASQFQKMLWVVLRADELWGSKRKYEDYTADVSTDRLVETDLAGVSGAVSSLLKDALQPYIENDTIPAEAAKPILASIWRLVLQALDIEEANELTSDEAFGIAKRPEEKGKRVRSTVKGKSKRKRKDDDEKKLVEVIDPETKKFKPAVATLGTPDMPDVNITAEDIEAALTNWDANKPPELRGLLRAPEVTKKEQT